MSAKPAAATNLTVVDQEAYAIMNRVMLVGDLSKLSEQERSDYYMAVCRSVGLNPLTRPFDYIWLEERLTLYARKDCAEQLRKINKVSTKIVGKELIDDVFTVHVSATDKDNRQDEDIGAVVMVYPMKMKTKEGWVNHPHAGKPLKGLDRANAQMKAVTKAKRRVTLSISGLGLPDESEVHDMLAAERDPPEAKEKAPSVRPPVPGEKKALPPKVGEKVEEGPQKDKPEPAGPNKEKMLADYQTALDSVTALDKLQKAHVKANKAISETEDDVLIEKAFAYYQKRQSQLKGEPIEEAEQGNHSV